MGILGEVGDAETRVLSSWNDQGSGPVVFAHCRAFLCGVIVLKAVKVMGARSAAERVAARAARMKAKASRGWYNSARWRALRLAQLKGEPLCKMHLARGEIVAATVCDHVQPHREDEGRFWAGPFQSLCAPCHASVKQREEARARGVR